MVSQESKRQVLLPGALRNSSRPTLFKGDVVGWPTIGRWFQKNVLEVVSEGYVGGRDMLVTAQNNGESFLKDMLVAG